MADKNSISEIPTTAKKKKSGIVVPYSPKWHQRLAAFCAWIAVSAVSLTIRYRVRDPHGFLQRKDFGPAIFCFWHNRLALCVKIYFKFRRQQFSSPGVAGLVSASRDGALLSAIFQCFDVQPVRGSSSRRGAQALLELTSWAERGYDLAITPDGPRGPCYEVQDGVISTAQLTNLPIVPVSYRLNWKIRLKSWDKFQIPLPFSFCEITIGKPIFVPGGISDEQRETFRKQLEQSLNEISRD